MDISILFAHILGITFTGLGLSMIINKKWTTIVVDEIFKNQSITWLVGLFTLLLGSMIVVLNNIWTSGLPLFITILGWLTLCKGVVILIFPNFSNSYYKKINKENTFICGGIIIFILGLILVLQ